ncbi:MAG: hypothetical protein RPS47_12045 [Colwellia sp.]|jgi:hypothetical protein
MINRFFGLVVFCFSIFNINTSFAGTQTEVDWCSVDTSALENGVEINYLDLLGYTPIPHAERFPFTVSELTGLVAQAPPEQMYIETVEGQSYLYIVDGDVVRFPRAIELETFVTDLVATDIHYLNILGVTSPDAGDFPYSQQTVEGLVLQQQETGSSDVFIQNQLETVLVDGVEQEVSVAYIYIVDEQYNAPVGELLSEFVASLNVVEDTLNDYGLSIRDGADFADGDSTDASGIVNGIDLYAVFTDPELLEDQVLEVVRLEIAQRANECINQLLPKDCPILDYNDVLNIPGVSETTKVEISDGREVAIGELVLAVNTSALAACVVGHYIFSGESGSGFNLELDSSGGGPGVTWARFSSPFPDLGSFTSNVFGKLDLAIGDIGFGDGESFLSPLLLEFKTKFGSFDDIKLEFEGYATNISTYFSNLIGSDDDGDGIAFPDIPNIFKYEVVNAPPPPPLEITKSYDWVGLDVGSSSTVAVLIDAYAEMRAGEQTLTSSDTTHAFAHYAKAEGHATVTILGKEASLASAYAYAYAGMDRVSAQMDAQIFGYNWDETGVGKDVPLPKIVETYDKSHSESWTFVEQVIFLGPIPLRLHAGAFVRSGLNVEYGLVSLKVYAQARPYAAAGMTASATLDIIIVSAGVQASLTLVDVGTPITAQAALMFTDNGEPYIDMDLNGDIDYSILDGYFGAYVKYYVPRASIPPWKKKKINKKLFSWTGMGANQSIFSWGATLGGNGLQLRGNPLTMGITDLDEGATLNDKVIAIINYQSDTNNKVTNNLEAVISQLSVAPDVIAMTGQGLTQRQALTTEVARYDSEMVEIFNSEDPMQIDTDNDGVIDIVEEEVGTDPLLADTDGDGLDDGYELDRIYLNPNNPGDANMDKDGDGFSNLEEFEADSDPDNINITPDNIAAIIMIPILGLLLH